MKKIETAIKGVYIIESDCYGDHRGWFMETYNQAKFHEMGINTIFVQDNMSYSAQKGTLRGLHYQRAPYSQAKLVRCTKGTVIDVAVDIRKGSPTYGKWVSCELSDENKRMFYLPKGMAHGFLTVTDDVEFQYKCDELYNKESEGGIRYDDPTINVDWGTLLNGIEPVLSEKDKNAPSLADCNANFVYENDLAK
ncbi:MAG: dTDP-4-dehydrorhamnose 3,5-epimerase [Erysipelotrichaceae bacterium]|nr:dTDP-4-dehydrorhamnose 3,5-epimerase [Erysipelotrichaceae bacterium]